MPAQRRGATRAASAFDELAIRLREMARQEHRNSGSGAERFKVTQVEPLVIEEMRGDLVLEEDDPDFSIGAWARQLMLVHPLVVGDEVWCLREGAEWHLVDVTDPGGQTPWLT